MLEVAMQPIESMLRRTSHRVTRQRELFALRARKAGSTFTSETRTASREFVSAVRAEADAWTKYVREGTTAVSSAIAPVTIERTLLVRVDLALRALEERVRSRISKLEGRGRRARSAKAKRANGAGAGTVAVSRRGSSASRARAHAS